MICIEVGRGINRCVITFDGGLVTVEGDERFAGGMKTLAAAIRKQIGCKSEDDDSDRNAGEKMAEMMGGKVLALEQFVQNLDNKAKDPVEMLGELVDFDHFEEVVKSCK